MNMANLVHRSSIDYVPETSEGMVNLMLKNALEEADFWKERYSQLVEALDRRVNIRESTSQEGRQYITVDYIWDDDNGFKDLVTAFKLEKKGEE